MHDSLLSPKTFSDSTDVFLSKKWLRRFNQIITKSSNETFLNNEQLAEKLQISERQLYRKVKTLTGLSPQQYIRQYRLQQAMIFLRKGTYRTVNETAYAMGYSNVGYFIAQFEKVFGKKPLRILQENGWR